MVIECKIVRVTVVCHVKVVGLGGKLGGKGVDLLYHRANVERLTVGANIEFAALQQTRDLHHTHDQDNIYSANELTHEQITP